MSFLRDALENPHPAQDIVHDLLVRLTEDEPETQRRETITRLVEHLARPDRDARRVILAALAETGAAHWPTLIELMSDDRLSVRAAAAGALLHLTRADLTFDPFGDPQQRQQELDKWRNWLAQHSP